MRSNKFTQFSSINNLLGPLHACSRTWWTERGGGQSGATGEDEPTSLSLPLVPVISLAPPPTTGEMSAKLQAVTALRTLVHGAPRWGRDGLFGAGGGWQMAGSCGVSRASLSQLWGEGRSPACRRGHGWWAEQQVLPRTGDLPALLGI